MNKGIVVLVLLVAVMSVNALGSGIIGPPTAGLNKGQWSVGYNYMYSDMDWGKATMHGSESVYVDGVLDEDDDDSGPYSYRLKMDDVKTQRHYATFGYGVEDWWEVYFQLGAADVKARIRDTDDPDDADGYNFDNDFAWGWGTKVTFCEQDNISWGASLQMNWLDTSWDTKFALVDDDIDNGTVGVDIDIETWDLLIAVGPTVDMGGWKLYGGPFYYHMSADLDLDITVTGTQGVNAIRVIEQESGELNSDSFGAYIGAQFDLSASTNVTTEFGFTEDGWALGTGITWKF